MRAYWKQLSFLVVLFFLILVLIQLSSLYLFYSYYFEPGLDVYFFGDNQTPAKTMGGLFEVMIPHLGSQGIILFLISHFLVLFSDKNKFYDQVAIALLASGFLNILAGPIVFLTGVSAIKLITYICFQVIFSYSLYLMFKSFVFNHLTSET